jgi:hypothetical protein
MRALPTPAPPALDEASLVLLAAGRSRPSSLDREGADARPLWTPPREGPCPSTPSPKAVPCRHPAGDPSYDRALSLVRIRRAAAPSRVSRPYGSHTPRGRSVGTPRCSHTSNGIHWLSPRTMALPAHEPGYAAGQLARERPPTWGPGAPAPARGVSGGRRRPPDGELRGACLQPARAASTSHPAWGPGAALRSGALRSGAKRLAPAPARGVSGGGPLTASSEAPASRITG